MEKKIAEEQEHIRTIEERRKILMNDDTGIEENIDAFRDDPIEDKNNNLSVKGISPALQASEVIFG